ncbi:hypothetical protein CNR22_01370 [Sphingobacteriaceae bacterium]|nr:hypothetical protein CNR22_01370 [Sphingobacteriaceae bacterium]
MNNSKSFFGTVMLGVAAGIAIGILIAPDKGSETRRKLIGGAQDLADDLKEKIQEGTDKFNEMKEMVQGRMDEMKERALAYSEETQAKLS